MIIIIDNYDSFTHNLYQLVSLFHDDVRVIRNDKITPRQIKHMNPQGLILSPGPGHPINAGICVELIRTIASGFIAPIPLLGVCLGHQALALAFGAEVVFAPYVCHGKADLIYHDQTGFYKGMSSPFQAGRYHSLMVLRESLPSTLLVDAQNNQGLVMGMHHRNLPLYGVQFHPESILSPEGRVLLKAFVSLCTKTLKTNEAAA